MTVNLLIRDVPETVRNSLAQRARDRGQSMQAYLYELISAEARRAENLRLLVAARAVGGGTVEPDSQGTAELVRELREDREARLTRGRDGR